MIFLYNFAFLLFAIFSLPRFLSKAKQAEDGRRLYRERLGIFSEEWRRKLVGKKVIWLHAVSVGEVLAVKKFIELFLERSPEYHFVLTTVTPTGQKIARQQMEGEKVTVCYFPFDWTPAVRSFFKALGPECLLLAETEIWPNVLMEAARAHVPVGVLNARLSPASAGRYARFSFFFEPLFRQLKFVLTQTKEDASRFEGLGTDSTRIHVLGNMKFDNVSLDLADVGRVSALRQEWLFHSDDLILIAGSTHQGEEEILKRVYHLLLGSFPELKLVIAPRHIERSESIARRLRKSGLSVRFSYPKQSEGKTRQVLILNQLGLLKQLYALADVVFMGGSLVRHGGQNPIEPASYKRAIVHGPYVFNFEKIYQLFDQEGASLQVRDEDQLAFALKRLLGHQSERTNLGESAFAALQKLQGATERHVEWLRHFLAPGSQFERKKHVEPRSHLFPAISRRP